MSDPIRLYIIDSAGASKLTGHLLPLDEIRVVGVSQGTQQALTELPRKKPSAILLSTNNTEEGSAWISELRRGSVRAKIIAFGEPERKLQMLSSGAAAYLNKPGVDSTSLSRFAKELKDKLVSLFATERPTSAKPRVLVLGSSTGGPDALATFLSGLPGEFPLPILIVQHMLPNFTKSLVERLAAKSKIPVSVSKPGSILTPNKIWVAEGGVHLAVEAEDSLVKLIHSKEPPENSCRPAVDVLFRSVARVFGGSTFGIIFTGMGRDGLRGSQDITRVGGEIWAQDEATSVVWGMPGAVTQAGLAKRVLPIQELAPQCLQFLNDARVPLKGALL